MCTCNGIGLEDGPESSTRTIRWSFLWTPACRGCRGVVLAGERAGSRDGRCGCLGRRGCLLPLPSLGDRPGPCGSVIALRRLFVPGREAATLLRGSRDATAGPTHPCTKP